MAAGLQTFDSGGILTLDVTQRITRLVYTRNLPADETSSVSIAGFDASKGVAFALPYAHSSYTMPHQVNYSGSTVSWRAGPVPNGAGNNTRTDSVLMVFMYA